MTNNAILKSLQNDFSNSRLKINQRIEKLESELAYWRDELKAFDRVESTIQRLEGGSVSVADSTDCAKLLKASVSNHSRKRGDLKKRVLAAVMEKAGQQVSSTEIEQTLLHSGYSPKGARFDISVFQTLNRLAKAKLIERKRTGSKVRFCGKIKKNEDFRGTGADQINAPH
jgi:hypothetical protein